MRLAVLLAFVPACAAAQPPHYAEIQRALVQRDQMTAEFAASLRGAAAPASLEALHARQLGEVMLPLAPELRPYQRSRMAQERELVLAPPVARAEATPAPLSLPGRARRGVDPVAPDRFPD